MLEDVILVLMVGLFIAAVVGVGIWVAVAMNRRHKKRSQNGPGSASIPPATDPWRRFTRALAAPYTRREWEKLKGTPTHAPEQTYFGYGSCTTPWTVRQQLENEWSVRNARSANVKAFGIAQTMLSAARALLVVDTRFDLSRVREWLTHAGVPREAIDALDPEELARIRATERPEGADIEGLRNELAFGVGRYANIIRWSAFTGLIDGPTADTAGDVIGTATVVGVGGWSEFGDRFLAGMYAVRSGADSARVGSIDWLKSDPQSPWQQQAWPA